MVDRSLELQKQIVDNSKTISTYYKDLYDWEKNVNTKDNLLNKSSQIQKTKENIREPNQNKIRDESLVETSIKTEPKHKRDINSIKDYYNHWDKFDVDKEVELIEKAASETKRPGMLDNYKPSSAQANTKVKITNNRFISNEDQLESVQRLKNDANAYFTIGNYNKSIELNSAALKILEQNKITNNAIIIAIYNNKGNCYLKLKMYKESINELDYVVKNDPHNTKALFRRGLCYLNLGKPNAALHDLNLAHEKSNESEQGAIKEFVLKAVAEINNTINTEKRRMEDFEYSTKNKFKQISVPEINTENLTSSEKETLKEYLRKKENLKQNQVTNNSEQKIENTESIPRKSEVRTLVETSIKKEELLEFIYDMTKEKLTSSSFKYALRNFKDSTTEKDDFIMVSYIVKN